MLIATAGHVDHGKTALIRALTGADTDRLPEERKRGISIDLGFAYWQPDAGDRIGFIDVPGHERYVRNMLAGVGGIDLALIVVAADDGVMPQTREHVAMLDMLGVARAVVAITKADKVDEARIAEVRSDIGDLLAETGLDVLSIHPVSAHTGAKLAALATALQAARHAAEPDTMHGLRLAIDRAFTVTGAGTVVSGTIRQGRVTVGDRLILIPGDREVRVRGLQSAGHAVTEAGAGMRCALNLASIEAADLHRGDWLLDPRIAFATTRISAEFTLQPAHEKPLRDGAHVHIHLGTADIVARIRVPRQAAIKPGERQIVQFLLDDPAHAQTGDRFVVRDPSGQHLLGGGIVADPQPPATRKRNPAHVDITRALLHADSADALAALLHIPGIEIDIGWFARAFGLLPEPAAALFSARGTHVLGREQVLAIPEARYRAIGDSMVAALRDYHTAHPESGGLAVRELRSRIVDAPSPAIVTAILRDLTDAQRIETAAALLRIPGHQPSFSAGEIAMWNAMLDGLDDGPPRPIVFSDLVHALRKSEVAVRAMLHRRRAAGEIWAVTDTKYLLRDHAAALADICADLVAAQPEGFTAADLRTASGIGRNFIIQLLEFFDRIGVTARRGERRIIRADYDVIIGSQMRGTGAQR